MLPIRKRIVTAGALAFLVVSLTPAAQAQQTSSRDRHPGVAERSADRTHMDHEQSDRVEATGAEALFITRYAVGEEKLEKRTVPDWTETAFAFGGSPWRIHQALTLSASVPVFYRYVEEISPELRGRLLFAIDDHGQLSVYRDRIESRNIVQSFGHLDVDRLRKAMPQRMWAELREGVRIDTIEEYRSVLSTIAEYMI